MRKYIKDTLITGRMESAALKDVLKPPERACSKESKNPKNPLPYIRQNDD